MVWKVRCGLLALVAIQTWNIHRHGVALWLSLSIAVVWVLGFVAIGYFGAGGPAKGFFPSLFGKS